MHIIMMIFMLLCVWGIAGLCYLLSANGRLGMGGMSSTRCLAVAAIGIVAVQGIAGLIGRLIPYFMSVTAGLLLLAGLAGHFMLFWSACSTSTSRIQLSAQGRKMLTKFYSPGLLCTGVAFVLALVLVQDMLVFRYDDLKQWGSAAKFMVEHNAMPREHEFFGSLNHYLTPVFFTSFFGIGGRWVSGQLVEADLYAANILLSAIGLCIPLGEFGWKDAKRVFAIFGLSLLCITALYYHSIVNLYVDIPFAAWVGGLIGWLLLFRRIKGPLKRWDYLFLAVCLCWVVFIKWGYGLLGVGLVLVALFLIEYSHRATLAQKVDKLLHQKRFWLGLLLGGALCGIIIWLLSLIFGENLNKVLPGAGSLLTSVFDILSGGSEKAVLTTKACIMGLFDQKVSRGFFDMGLLTALIAIGLCAWLQSRSVESIQFAQLMRRLNTAWLVGSVVWFSLILVTYVSNFAFAEATIALSFNRYMGLYLMIGGFVLMLLLFLPEEYLGARSGKPGQYVFASTGKRTRGVSMRGLMQVVCCLVLLLNVDANLIRESTGFDAMRLAGYGNITAVHAQSNVVKQLTKADDNILFIAQRGAERSLHRARMDVGMNVSGYQPNTYHFSATADSGYDLSQIRPTEELPQLIQDGQYDYIWVYKTDRELNAFTRQHYGFDFEDATLYRVEQAASGIRLYELAGLEAE